MCIRIASTTLARIDHFIFILQFFRHVLQLVDWVIHVTDFHKHIFKCGDRDAIRQDVKSVQISVELMEEVFEHVAVLPWNLQGHFRLDF